MSCSILAGTSWYAGAEYVFTHSMYAFSPSGMPLATCSKASSLTTGAKAVKSGSALRGGGPCNSRGLRKPDLFMCHN